MRTFALGLVVLVAGCGEVASPESSAARSEINSGHAIGERCERTAECAEGLKCEAARGSSLCLPRAWFTGVEGGWCFGPADCSSGFRCDTEQAPHPIADGSCRASTLQ